MSMLIAPSIMNNPLVIWIQTFTDGDILSYKDLSDGVFLNNVLSQIDPKANTEGLLIKVDQPKHRLQNWDILLRNIRTYYQDVLQQLIVMPHPNIICISKEPETEAAHLEVYKVLLLILGCAVQCERKEEFIETIEKRLELEVQFAIVDVIKEITEDRKNVFSIDLPDDEGSELSMTMRDHLRSLVQERDFYVDEMKNLTTTVDELYQAQVETQRQPKAAPSPEKQNNQALELAENKAKLRKVRQELEERTEQIHEYVEELDILQKDLNKIKQENRILIQDARSARTYRDELDIWKEKAQRFEKYEAENEKLRSKLNELEYYKTRVEELREDNRILDETRAMLEEKLDGSSKRVERVMELENDLIKYKEKFDMICKERDESREKMEELIEINARLEFEKKTSFTESANLEEELARAKFNASNNLSKSLGEQLKDSSNAKILRLEMENNRLTKQLAEMKENAALESAQRLMEVEKENARLSRKVESMHEVQLKENEQMILLEEEREKLTSQKVGLEKTLETVRENMERQIREFRVENEQLNLNLSSLRKRCEKTNDIRVGEMEKENVRLQDTVKEINTRLRDLEFEKKKRESNDKKIEELEDENERYEKECNELHKKLAKYTFIEQKYEKLEVETADLEAENRKLNKIASNLRSRVEKGEEAEKQNISLSTENERLTRCLESVKNTSMKAVDFEHEKEELLREITKLKNLNNISKEVRTKNEKLQVENMKLTSENRKYKKSVETATGRLEEVLNERSDLERTFEDLRRKAKRHEEIEVEMEKFETENSDLLNCKAHLENELRKLRLTVEQSQKNFEEERSKSVVVERELKQVKRIADRYLETNAKIQELESDNGELAQKCGVQSREITVLRQDLVNEKIGSQQLRNDLENMKRELNKHKAIGEYTQKAASDEEKFKSLEHLMQDAFKRSLELKDEKIRELDTRLAESKNRNIQIQETLRSVQRDHNILLQRAEEDKLFSKSLSNDSKNHVKSRLGNEIIELKDHLIQLERTNATLETENRSMQIHSNKLQEKNDNMEKIRNDSQIEVRSCQSRLESLQRQNAQLQVDNRTFQSHLTSCQQQLNVAQKTKSSISSELENALRQYEKLQEDCEKLQKLNDQLNAENDRFAKEFSNAKRASEDEWKHRNDILQKEIDRLQKNKADQEEAIREAVDQVREADLEICKLTNKVDSLEQIICKLEEENRGLMYQLQTILNQNQDLLTTVLESKQHMHDEQRQYLEKMNDLRRQKEKLEEKIMDQFKRYEPSPKRKTSFAANLVRRAKGMMTRTKSKEWGKASEIKEGEENSSFGSGSFGSGSFDESGTRRGGKKSTPSSMSKSKNFTRSTTAINLVGNGHSSSVMRSAKSSENLFGDEMDSSWNTSNSKRKHVRDLSLMINSSDQTSISEDAPDEQITLSQFLNESNKSPKSRRKFLLEKKVDLTTPDTEADIKETDLAIQGPRSATIIDEDEQKILRHQTRAKSEMNIPISQSPQARPHSVMGMPDQQPQTTQTLPRHYFRPKSAVPYESDQNGYPARPKEREMRTDSYAPGSVRNLVKSYHEATNNRPEPPAPPPRRVRPIIGNPKSAFSRPDSGRKLPSTPTSAGSTPPKPDPKKKPGIWYEYGCV